MVSSDLNQYIALQNITEKEFQNFIETLSDLNREVILLYYGDHQPMIPVSDYQTIGIQEKYEVPYVLWSNKQELTTYQNIDMNYLPILIMDAANITYNSYFQYIKKELIKNPLDSNDELYTSWMYYQLTRKD